MSFNLNGITLPIDGMPEKKVIIYGSGQIADYYTTLIEEVYGCHKIEAYVVTGISSETQFHQKEILSFERLKELEVNGYYYIIASFSAVRTMKKNLLELGIEAKNIHETIDMWSVEVMQEVKEVDTNAFFYPPVKTEEQLHSILELIKEFYNPDIHYHISIEPTCNMKEMQFSLPNIIISKEIYQPKEKDFILIWNRNNVFDFPLKEVKHKFCVDKTISEVVTVKIMNCFLSCLSNQTYLELSLKNWRDLVKKYQGQDSIVFGNGPSLETFLESSYDIKDYITVVCNQIYLDEKAMHQIQPDVYLLYDQAYFQEENIDVLEDILSVIKAYNCYLVVPFIFVPFLVNRKNINKEKLIGIDTYGKEMRFLSENELIVKRVYSVITTLGFPLASFLSPTVYFVGCDGKQRMENDKYFWPYARTLNEEVESLSYEKAFKNYNESTLGYEQHCNEFEKLIHYGEGLGKKYYSLTKSYIPILAANYKGSD